MASKTWNRSPERSQMVISPESEAPVVVGVVEPHAASSDVPPVASSALAAVPFKKERRERFFRITDKADDRVGVIDGFSGVDIRVYPFLVGNEQKLSVDAEIIGQEKRTKNLLSH